MRRAPSSGRRPDGGTASVRGSFQAWGRCRPRQEAARLTDSRAPSAFLSCSAMGTHAGRFCPLARSKWPLAALNRWRAACTARSVTGRLDLDPHPPAIGHARSAGRARSPPSRLHGRGAGARSVRVRGGRRRDGGAPAGGGQGLRPGARGSRRPSRGGAADLPHAAAPHAEPARADRHHCPGHRAGRRLDGNRTRRRRLPHETLRARRARGTRAGGDSPVARLAATAMRRPRRRRSPTETSGSTRHAGTCSSATGACS